MEELKKQAHKEFEKILDEIIADEENSECNVGYYKESYLNRLDSLIDKTVQMTEGRIGTEIELLRLAYEELLELRGYLVGSLGKFNPDTQKLEKYWNSGKPEWEKKLSIITNKSDINN